jgi:hypothetical protein
LLPDLYPSIGGMVSMVLTHEPALSQPELSPS